MFMCYASLAQVKPFTFPKIKPADFNSGMYEKDTSATAVILGDQGETYFEYNDTKGFQMVFTRHLRIRILTKEGYGFATLSIPLYQNKGLSETLTQLKGYTYNLVGGKVEDDKLGGSNIFEEQINTNWKDTKFTMPDVKTGSIIDIQYRILSDYLSHVREWKFQYTIPVQWSEYTVTAPEYFVFSKLTHGSLPFAVSEMTAIPGSVSLVTKNRVGTNAVSTSYEREQINFIQNVYHFAVKDIPAIKEEPFSPAMTNFISKIEFQLDHTQFPGETRKDYTTTWQDICDQLVRDEDFGERLQHGRIVKEAVKNINTTALTPFDKMNAAHDFIRKKMVWTGKFGIYTTSSLRKAFDEGIGNDADINLLLVVLLKELDLDASPVVLSTRDNGLLLESHPVITQLNYVLASASIEGKTYLLDATGKHYPRNILPSCCLNGNGLLVSSNDMRWIPLLNDEKQQTLTTAEMKISPEGIISGELKVSHSGYSAEEVRHNYAKEGVEKYLKSLKELHKTWKIDEILIENTDSLGKPVNQRFRLSSEEMSQKDGNMIYFNALLGLGQINNPFKAEKRENVVDFIYPVQDTYFFTFEIPEGYMVESIPETVKLMLPDQAVSFRFIVSTAGNKINVNSKLSITKVMFTADEYVDLREFFTRVVAKHMQQIVIKKA